MICASCGQPLLRDVSFCGSCGARVEGATASLSASLAVPPPTAEVPLSHPSPQPEPEPDDDFENDRTLLAPPRAHRATWILVTPSGAREPIVGTVVAGRQPTTTAFTTSDRSLILQDPSGQVSKSHVVLEVDDEGLWVRDLGSTNGLVVITPGGLETIAEGDARIPVPAGSELELGGYVVTIERNE